MIDQATCTLCGYPMPEGEEMFKFHGYSGPCPKEPLSPPQLRPPTPAGWSDTDWIKHLQESTGTNGQTR